MYCINCGVKLADGEKRCPLCGTVAFHPDIPRPEGIPLYPPDRYPNTKVGIKAILGAVTILLLVPILVTLICDLSMHHRVTWSGYAVGGILLCYLFCVLPQWFQRPNPVILVPCSFAATGLYVLYIDLSVHGGWFLSFAFPVVGFLGVLVTAVIVLTHYTRGGAFYIFGGALIALGAFMPLMEYLMTVTFHLPKFMGWSWYPLVALVVMGGALIFLAICRPARESAERKLFL